MPAVPVFEPAPGHITVELFAMTIKAKRSAPLPRHLALRFRQPGSLPPSDRVLVAQRRIRSGGTVIYSVMLLVLHKAKEGANVAAATASDTLARGYRALDRSPTGRVGARVANDQPDVVSLIWRAARGISRSHIHRCPHCGDRACSGGRNCPARFYESWVNVDTATPKQTQGLRSLLDHYWTDKGSVTAVWGKEGAPAADPNLDTGHYDDGHAFGWNANGAKDAEAVTVSDYTTAGIFGRGVVADIEADIGADLNGDGIIGSGPGGTTTSPGPGGTTGPGPGGTTTGPGSGSGGPCHGQLQQEEFLVSSYGGASWQTQIPASCQEVLTHYSLYVQDAASPTSPYYFCNDGAGPPAGQLPCSTITPQPYPTGATMTAKLIAPGDPTDAACYASYQNYCVLITLSGGNPSQNRSLIFRYAY